MQSDHGFSSMGHSGGWSAVAEDSAAVVAVAAVDSTVVAEAGGNMTTRIFTINNVRGWRSSACAQAPQAGRRSQRAAAQGCAEDV